MKETQTGSKENKKLRILYSEQIQCEEACCPPDSKTPIDVEAENSSASPSRATPNRKAQDRFNSNTGRNTNADGNETVCSEGDISDTPGGITNGLQLEESKGALRIVPTLAKAKQTMFANCTRELEMV
ncbi:hypothetical protein BY996DRAFT_6451361 [Phakopsora pachyrhizi]|uniref:Uncharacterized protein n=1 Tax=Phakopsora pachyrhizi TaxID=170000 RepID=A0AAV0BAJ0_PHAPC|nr:hypothetical protein BY996DRAFT_6451361 [Phakopsora pachyrhizi]CAH7682646.1 hypothetical protein PPACK8108_LOCUS15679 [Phakopsora pachyrhizi]